MIVVGASLPDGSGLDVVEEVRDTHDVPAIVLSERAATGVLVEVLDRGADDVVVKPFHGDELRARIRALLRRRHDGLRTGRRRIGDTVVDLDHRLVSRDDEVVDLRRPEWLLVEELVANEGRVLLHEELLSRVMGPAFRDDRLFLRTLVCTVRRRLGIGTWEEGPIRTLQGIGYAFDPLGLIPRSRSRRPRAGRSRQEK